MGETVSIQTYVILAGFPLGILLRLSWQAAKRSSHV